MTDSLKPVSNVDPNGDTFGEFLSAPMEPTEAEARTARAKENEAALQAALDAHFAAKKGA